MALDNQDLQKIKAVIETEGQQTRTYVDKRVRDVEQRLDRRIDEVKEMLTEDVGALGGDVQKLKHRVTATVR